MKLRESVICMAYAERAIQARRSAKSSDHGLTVMAAMLDEARLIEEVLAPLELDYVGRMNYVQDNSVLVRATDGHEGIHIIFAKEKIICVHRLLSKEFRTEFGAQWLGVWCELMSGQSKELIIESFSQKVSHRVESRKEYGITAEIPFAISPALELPSFTKAI